MEGQRDHRFDGRKVNFDHPVVVCNLTGVQLAVTFGVSVQFIELMGRFIGLPDRGQAGGFGGHDVDAQTEVVGEARNARPDEFENPVGDKPLFEDSAAECDRDVMRADAVAGLPSDRPAPLRGRQCRRCWRAAA